MTGVSPERAEENPHIVVSDDGQAAVWVGAIDDLWEMDKPVGQGGPWVKSPVKAGEPSDPYLIAFYDQKNALHRGGPGGEADLGGGPDWQRRLDGLSDMDGAGGKPCDYVFLNNALRKRGYMCDTELIRS